MVVTACVVVPSGPAPTLNVSIEKTGLSIPWDINFSPDGAMVWTERAGTLSARFEGVDRQLTADFSDIWAIGEGGLLGLEIDPDFTANRRIYLCLAQGNNGVAVDVRVVPFTINADWTVATRLTPIISGMPISSGRHSGCRLRFDTSGLLYVAMGDAAIGTTPQDLTSMGGKLLRVDRFTGEGISGNPFFSSTNANTRRIWSYGHRNMQGLALRPGTNTMWTVEHGTGRDDEVNIGVTGNFGWDPVPGYVENAPMTDLTKFPDAIEANWSSGNPTTATSGATFISGTDWQGYNGMLAVAELKNQRVRMLAFDGAGLLIDEVEPPELAGTYGRLRTAQMGPDGALYLLTSNGSNDLILKVTPN